MQKIRVGGGELNTWGGGGLFKGVSYWCFSRNFALYKIKESKLSYKENSFNFFVEVILQNFLMGLAKFGHIKSVYCHFIRI